MNERHTCVDCRKKSPETNTDYTLISSQFGWRLSRRQDSAGALVVEWRCPTCWRKYKDARGVVIATTPSSNPPGASSRSSASTRPPDGKPPKPRS